jgi:hypothetical protein
MKIHPLNYEQYALDYLEGNLDQESEAAFTAFLREHPGIEKELNEMKLFYATPLTEEAYPNKKELMKAPPASASVFHLPSWAVAASWLVLLGSFAFWLLNANPTSQENQIASTPSPLETAENDIVVVQVDVERPKTRKSTTQSHEVETPSDYPVNEIQTPAHSNIAQQESQDAQVENHNIDIDVQETPDNKEDIALLPLPQHTKLEDMEVPYQTPEVVYYRPIRYWNTTSSNNEQDLEQEPKLAVMDPLKRVMKPEGYSKIKEFNLMEDVLSEIDGREVAHAFTPEFLRNNR